MCHDEETAARWERRDRTAKKSEAQRRGAGENGSDGDSEKADTRTKTSRDNGQADKETHSEQQQWRE
jgi:hypothetical protein